MDSSIRSTLWGAFAVLVVLVTAGLALTIGILAGGSILFAYLGAYLDEVTGLPPSSTPAPSPISAVAAVS